MMKTFILNILLASFSFCYAGNKNLAILFVVDSFPLISETFVLNQITGLTDLGHEVWIYAKKAGDKIAHTEVQTYNLHKKVIYSTASEETKKEFFSQIPFNIVYCHFGPNGIMGQELIEKYCLTSQLVTVFHGFDMSRILIKDPLIYQDLFKHLSLALPISNTWKNRLIEFGCPEDKIIVHHMGIDCTKFPYLQRKIHMQAPIRLMSVSRLVEKKGLAFSIKAFAELVKEFDNIDYLIAGDGTLRQELEILITSLNLENRVQLLGSLTHEQLIPLLNAAHIFLAPSITDKEGDQEGIPVCIMEAMAMGLPVISTLHSGIPELVVHNKSGLLVPEKDSYRLHKAIEELLKHAEHWPEMGRIGNKKVSTDYNIKKLNTQLEKILLDLTTNKKGI